MRRSIRAMVAAHSLFVMLIPAVVTYAKQEVTKAGKAITRINALIEGRFVQQITLWDQHRDIPEMTACELEPSFVIDGYNNVVNWRVVSLAGIPLS